MGTQGKITGFKSYLWFVVLGPWCVSLIFGVGITAFGVFCLIRDQFMPKELQEKLATPHLTWQTWVRTPLPRKARFATDAAMLEFIRRAGGPKTLEDKNILAMMIQRKSGEITLELTDEQYRRLRDR